VCVLYTSTIAVYVFIIGSIGPIVNQNFVVFLQHFGDQTWWPNLTKRPYDLMGYLVL